MSPTGRWRRSQPGSGAEALGDAVRAAARFDRTMVSAPAGALAALAVVVALGGGLALHQRVGAVTIGAGAMLVGMAWRSTGGRPPLTVMTVDAVVMALSTFVGCVTGSVTWLHIVVLCAWSAAGGLLVGVGGRGGVVGTQAIVAVVVFGRFSQPAPQALGLAALVLAGGLGQVALLSVVRWPTPLRAQREATANGYRALAELASATGPASTLPAGAALDEAQASTSGPSLLGDPALLNLRSLIAEGLRLRVQLAAIRLLIAQRDRAGGGGDGGGDGDGDGDGESNSARQAVALVATALHDAAGAILGEPTAAQRLAAAVVELDARLDAAPLAPALERRLAAVAGQVRAAATLAPAAGRGGGLRNRRPRRAIGEPRERRLDAVLEQLRANLSTNSPAGRHALRLAIVVPIAVVIARVLPLERGYWVAVAAATVLRPEFGATFTRGTERALGTVAGVGLVGAVTAFLHPAGVATVALAGLLAWAGYAMMPASFAAGFAFITALVVLLIDTIVPVTASLAGARLLDTLIGGALGLLAFGLWPTWARGTAWQSLADLVGTQRAYINTVLAAVAAGKAPDERARAQARACRLARTRAEETVARSLSEPRTRRIDTDRSRGALAASRRLVFAAHALRLDAGEAGGFQSQPALATLQERLDRLLALVERALRESGHAPVRRRGELPDTRAAHRALARAVSDPDSALVRELDEIVDAANGLAVHAGLRPDEDTRTQAHG